MTGEDQRVVHNRMGDAVRYCLGVSYDDDAMVGSRYSEWVNHLMKFLVGLFCQYRLAANVANVLHNDVPTRRNKVGDVRGGQGSEVHWGGRLLLHETP